MSNDTLIKDLDDAAYKLACVIKSEVTYSGMVLTERAKVPYEAFLKQCEKLDEWHKAFAQKEEGRS